MITRPTPEQIAARKLEIKRRYARASGKVGKRTRSMAAIRLAELTRWLEHTCGQGQLLPDERSVEIVRIFAHHMGGLPDPARRITTWTRHYAPWISPRDIERLISDVTNRPLKWSADKLAWKLRMTDATRTALKIRTIGAIDVNKEQRQARRKAANALLMRQLRAKRRQEREQHID